MGALGAHGAGHTHKVDGRDLVFSPYTQGIMDAFADWLFERRMQTAMDIGEVYRRKARKLMAKANAMREENLNNVGLYAANTALAAKLKEDFEDAAGEAQSLQMEAREMVDRIADNKTIGAYHFFGLLAREARDQVDGRAKIAHLMLLPKQPGITLAEVELLARPGPWKDLGAAIAEANEAPKKDGSPSPSPEVSTPALATTISATTSTPSGLTTPATTP